MPRTEIIQEDESASGWSFTVQVLDGSGSLRRHRIRLSWADYNLWSPSGADEPSRVAEAVVQFLLSLKGPEGLPDALDASLARRLSRDADEAIPNMIRDGRI